MSLLRFFYDINTLEIFCLLNGLALASEGDETQYLAEEKIITMGLSVKICCPWPVLQQIWTSLAKTSSLRMIGLVGKWVSE